MLIYRIERDKERCSDCGRCEEHWPGVIRRFNCQGFFDLDNKGFSAARHQFEWAKNLCPEDAIGMKVVREDHQNQEDL